MLEFWIDPQSPYFKDTFGSDKKFIFHFEAGWRSVLSVATLNDMGLNPLIFQTGLPDGSRPGDQ